MKPVNSQRYTLADDFDERSKDLSMRRSAWTIISSISQLQFDTSFKEFCSDVSLSENDANSVISELLTNRLIFENELTEDKQPLLFRPIANLLKGTYSTLAVGMFGNENHVEESVVTLVSSSSIKMRLGNFQETQPSPSAIRSWIWESNTQSKLSAPDTTADSSVPSVGSKLSDTTPFRGKDSQRSTTTTKGNSHKKSEVKKYKLQPIISQIEKLSSGGVEGSVLVYQVFLKVPTELLRDEGIESLKLVDANTEFTSQKLCQAIIRATNQITGYNLKIVGYNR